MSRDKKSGMRIDIPTARRSTIIKQRRRNKQSNRKNKRRFSSNLSPIAERFQLKLKHCIGGGVQHPQTCVIRGRSTVISGHRTVIHIAFPIKNDAHAFKTMSLLKIRKALVGANHHSHTFLLPNGGNFANAGAAKLGRRALQALELREAIGVAVLISSWTYPERLPVNSESLKQTIIDLLEAAGHVKGKVMDPYFWGKGHSLRNSSDQLSAHSQVNKEERRRIVLAALEKRLNSNDIGELAVLPVKREILLKRKSDSWKQSQGGKVIEALEKQVELDFQPESRRFSSDEFSSEDGGERKFSEFLCELERTLISAHENESDLTEDKLADFENELGCDAVKAIGLHKMVRRPKLHF